MSVINVIVNLVDCDYLKYIHKVKYFEFNVSNSEKTVVSLCLYAILVLFVNQIIVLILFCATLIKGVKYMTVLFKLQLSFYKYF